MKTAIYGAWHVHAPEYTRYAKEYGEVVGVYDADAERRKAFCAELGVKEFSTPEELLESEAEGVIVCSATSTHAEDIIKIANAKKHIFTEKVLALTDEDCLRVEEAVLKNGVKFVISMFQKYLAPQRTVKKIADSGELGKINFLRFRNCHSGAEDDWLPRHFYDREECGGGAMIDLGAHGMYLAEWILGMPDKYASAFGRACENESANEKNSDGVEDNAVTVMTYENGCIAINETGFVSGASPLFFEVSGDAGYVRMEGERVIKCTKKTEMQTVEVPNEEAEPLPIIQFLTDSQKPGCSIEEAKKLTHMMVKAYENII